MDYISVVVAQNLHFDMLRSFDVFLNEDIIDAEGLFRFGSGALVLSRQFFAAANDSHSASAAACRCLEHDRIAALFSKLQRCFHIRNLLGDSRNCRHADRLGDDLGLHLVSKLVHHVSARAYEHDTIGLTCPCELRILSQESVSRMYGVDALCLCQFDNFIYCQISVHGRFAHAYLI